MEHFPLNLRLRRLNKGLTQTELSELLAEDHFLAVSQATISRLEKGKTEPSTSLLIAFSGIFDCRIEALLLPVEVVS